MWNDELRTTKRLTGRWSRELAPTGPFGFWLEKIFKCLLFLFESRTRQAFDPHWECYLGNHLLSVGFRFRPLRYSRNVLSRRGATRFFVPVPTPFSERFSRRDFYK